MRSRLIVAAVGIPLLLAVLCVLPPWGTAILFAAVCCIGVHELFHMQGLGDRKAAMVLCMVSSCAIQASILFGGYRTAMLLLLPFLLLLFLLWVAYYETDRPFGMEGLAGTLFSGLLVPLGLGAMTALRCGPEGRLLVLAPLFVTFTGDSGAYFVGRAWGKHKMSPRTSPHKTVEGLVGGLMVSALGMVLYGLLLLAFGIAGSLWKLAIVGLVGGVCAQLGDLAFSLIKRQYGAKDYGRLLPGHGGAYDRFDSTSFAAPATLLLLMLLEVFLWH